ncbi:cilia- and flagella-associated protein 157-like [Aethina tumida]|uniref:cilia- and flagella-associated protein 157-like n=1 Tax=Aethina tumida TaxID=116153 RepID=UPI0021480A09|nr:cilia- and flagella-associated protein 157-like [Aethina tumida]
MPKKGKKKYVAPITIITEVERKFYELHIEDLRKRIERQELLLIELEEKKSECKLNIEEIDGKNLEIIKGLQVSLSEKHAELNDVQQAIVNLNKSTDDKTQQYEDKIEAMDREYDETQAKLTSQNKLLTGSLNNLEEFRNVQQELLEKYDERQKSIDEEEHRHELAKKDILEKFEIMKDKLTNDMENRLLQLSSDFQTHAMIKMPATVYRMTRENTVIKNFMDILLGAQHSLQEEMFDLESQDKDLKEEAQEETEKNKVILKKLQVLKKVIRDLSAILHTAKRMIRKTVQIAVVTSVRNHLEELEEKRKIVNDLIYVNRVLQQNILELKRSESHIVKKYNNYMYKYDHLCAVHKEAKCSINEALDHIKLNNSYDAIPILKRLLYLIQYPTDVQDDAHSLSIISMDYKTPPDVELPDDIPLRIVYPVKRERAILVAVPEDDRDRKSSKMIAEMPMMMMMVEEEEVKEEESIHTVESVRSDPFFKESELEITIIDEEYDEIEIEEEEEEEESSDNEETNLEMGSKTSSMELDTVEI